MLTFDKEKINLIDDSNLFDNIRDNQFWSEEEAIYWENSLIEQTSLTKEELREFNSFLSYDHDCIVYREDYSEENLKKHNYSEEDVLLTKLFHKLMNLVEFSDKGGNMLNIINGIKVISETHDGGWNAVYFRYQDLNELIKIID